MGANVTKSRSVRNDPVADQSGGIAIALGCGTRSACLLPELPLSDLICAMSVRHNLIIGIIFPENI